MLLDRIGLKREAKTIIKGAKANAFVVTLIYMGICLVVSGIDTYVSGSITTTFAQRGLDVPVWLPQGEFPGLVVTFVGVVAWLIGILMQAGYSVYHLGIRRGKEMGIDSLFEGFAFAGKIILVNVVMYIFIVLWSFLFVIPGIVAAYRYRFAVYNICENPEMGVMEAIRMSKKQTGGFKWQLLMLDLSYIGWAILCALTIGILSIWVTPWVQQADVGYFQAIKAYKHIGSGSEFPNDGEFHSVEY